MVHMFDPWSGRIPHAMVQLSPVHHNYWAFVLQPLKPMCREPVLHKREVTALRSSGTATKSSPHLLQLEKTHAQQWRPSIVKINAYIKTVLKKRKWKQRVTNSNVIAKNLSRKQSQFRKSYNKVPSCPTLGFSMVPLWQKAAPSERMDPIEEKVLRSRWAKWEMVGRGQAAVSGSKSRPCWTNSGSPYLLRVWWQVYCILHGQAICF